MSEPVTWWHKYGIASSTKTSNKYLYLWKKNKTFALHNAGKCFRFYSLFLGVKVHQGYLFNYFSFFWPSKPFYSQHEKQKRCSYFSALHIAQCLVQGSESNRTGKFCNDFQLAFKPIRICKNNNNIQFFRCILHTSLFASLDNLPCSAPQAVQLISLCPVVIVTIILCHTDNFRF